LKRKLTFIVYERDTIGRLAIIWVNNQIIFWAQTKRTFKFVARVFLLCMHVREAGESELLLASQIFNM